MGALAALWARERSGRGQLVEGSLLRSALIHTNSLLIEQAVRAPDRVPQGNRGYLGAPGDLFCTRSGNPCKRLRARLAYVRAIKKIYHLCIVLKKRKGAPQDTLTRFSPALQKR